jgi:hypothetical protein
MAIGDRQSDRKITVASLCCDSGEAKSASNEPTEQRHLRGSRTRSPPDVVPIRTQDRHLGHIDTTVTFPPLLSAELSSLDGSGLVTKLSCASRSDTTNDFNGTLNVIGSTHGALPYLHWTVVNSYIANTKIG